MQRPFVTPLVMVVRVCWVVALLLGVLVYAGKLDSVGGHALLGLLVAASLFILAVRARALAAGPAWAGILVALLLPLLGLMQLGSLAATTGVLLPAAHVLLALAAIALSEILAKKLRTA